MDREPRREGITGAPSTLSQRSGSLREESHGLPECLADG